MTRGEAVTALYDLLDDARRRCGGFRYLRDANTRDLPDQGVYFFFDDCEPRGDGGGPRVVRVGTHAVSVGSRQTLAKRLRQHRGTVGGTSPGGGNHRGSVFRRHVGAALIARDGWPDAATTWAKPLAPGERPSPGEQALETAVSTYIGALPYLWVAAAGPASPTGLRARIERGAIAVLSDHRRAPINPPSATWLGHHARAPEIRTSGLWNVRHVSDPWQPDILDLVAVGL
jgi:hypothetical protein